MRISWTKNKSNEEVMEVAVYSKPSEKTTTICGHINRAIIGWTDFVVPKAVEDNAQNTQTV